LPKLSQLRTGSERRRTFNNFSSKPQYPRDDQGFTGLGHTVPRENPWYHTRRVPAAREHRVGDFAAVALGFLLTARLPVRSAVVALLLLEAVPALAPFSFAAG
jgi:hypothetical protein